MNGLPQQNAFFSPSGTPSSTQTSVSGFQFHELGHSPMMAGYPGSYIHPGMNWPGAAMTAEHTRIPTPAGLAQARFPGGMTGSEASTRPAPPTMPGFSQGQQPMTPYENYLHSRLIALENSHAQLSERLASHANTPASSDSTRGKGSRKRKRENALHILSRGVQGLNDDQKVVRQYLSKRARTEFCMLTGTSKDAFRIRHGHNGSDSDNDSTDVFGSTTANLVSPETTFHWDEDVDSTHNDRIIRHIARLIFDTQMTPSTCTLPRTKTSVQFTEEDIVIFIKTYVRSCRKARSAQQDPIRKERRLTSMSKNRRSGRKRTRKQQRLEGVPQYLEDHGVDPSCLLQTPFMSEDISECSLSDEDARNTNLADRRSRAGITEQDIESGVKVLEQMSLAWRSSRVKNIYAELDKNRRELYRKQRKDIPVSKFRRVDLGRSRDEIPQHSDDMPYQFMVDNQWLIDHPEYSASSFRNNPPGFETELSPQGIQNISPSPSSDTAAPTDNTNC